MFVRTARWTYPVSAAGFAVVAVVCAVVALVHDGGWWWGVLGFGLAALLYGIGGYLANRRSRAAGPPPS